MFQSEFFKNYKDKSDRIKGEKLAEIKYKSSLIFNYSYFIILVFSKISRDSGATDQVIDFRQDRKVEKRLLTEYRVISDALDRLGHGYELVEESIRKMNQEFPLIIR